MAFATDDSIVAIATPSGRGGIGVVRISGPNALTIARQILDHKSSLTPRYATVTRVTSGTAQDEVVATYFKSPHSYTGEHVVEISAHGSPVVLRGIVRAAMDAGARLAEPGEFTLRAFLNGKRDLVQAEAVGDLIAAATPLQARIAFDQLEGTLTKQIREIDGPLFELIARLEASLDFADEGYHFVAPQEAVATLRTAIARLDDLLADAGRGRMIRDGATLVIAGRVNVGKSSIFNKLAGSERAIVTAIPGTTRDLVTEAIDIEGLAVSVVDTAGWRDTRDVVEREGVARGQQARAVAGLVLIVLDRSEPLTEDDRRLLEQTAGQRRIVVLNKCDLEPAPGRLKPAPTYGSGPAPMYVEADFSRPEAIEVSAVTGAGIDELRRAIASALTGSEVLRDTAAISNVRHIKLLEDAREHLTRAHSAAEAGDTPEEFLLTDLQAARTSFDEVVGVRTSEDVLSHIFATFCIGK